jgi:glyoxylase I family protein
MIKVLSIDHVGLRTTDLEAMLHFYCDVLNCPVERELKDLGLIQLRAGDALIDIVPVDSELGKLGGKAPSQDGRNMDHLCLRIGQMDESQLLDYLIGHGIAVEELAERYGAQGHGRSLYIEDPERNTVELKLALE